MKHENEACRQHAIRRSEAGGFTVEIATKMMCTAKSDFLTQYFFFLQYFPVQVATLKL